MLPLRDMALVLLLVAAMPVSIARPYVGAVVFAWLSLMNPHRLTWGFAYGQSWAMMIGICTLIGFIATQDRQLADSLRQYRIALMYLFWTGITTVFALRFDYASGRLIDFFKIQLMCLVTLALLTTRRRIEIFAVVVVMSIAFYGIKGGYFTLRTGGGNHVLGPTHSVIGDNNQLAAALVMTVPMLYWVAHWVKARWQRYAVYGFMGLTAVAVFGSQSRGAFLAAVACGLFLILKTHKKILTLAFVGLIASISLLFMPVKYWDRIHSIASYETDGSARGRLEMWSARARLATERLTGGGFDAHGSSDFREYVVTTSRSSHSIYFQALGDHGWIGLALFLAFWASIWAQCRAGIKLLRGVPGTENLELLLRMTQVSLAAFAVGGAFVNIGYWDYPFYLAVTVLAVRRITAREDSVTASKSGPQMAPRMVPAAVTKTFQSRSTSLG